MSNQASISLQRAVMRRVWYSFVISLATHQALLAGVICGASIMFIKEWVFVERVLESLLNSGLMGLPWHFFQILLAADLPSVLAFALMVFSFYYFLRSLVYLSKHRSPTSVVA